ncbi:HD domain-containing protein [Desulfovibrio piger]|uniref:HD domain-containing protein n=1 Tax=Desulfovibrio piger TaxID=901 RepID=UPI0026EB5BC0|nr:HD domain-containing protein [Desulfovibrio piger]
MAQDSPNKSTPAAGLPDEQQMERITDFFHEAGHLRHTPRSGYAFLGSGSENVAEHSYRTSVIGYTLAKLAGADAARVTFLCLFHDLHEARTGDFNYVNHRYDTCRDRDALQDAVDGTGLEKDILEGWDELQERQSLEARLAHDADQLDLICNLKAELDKGNKFAADWLESAVKRLRSPQAQALCEVILRTDHNRWWYGRVDKKWWVDRK